jgi:hypothetical protein
MSEKDIPTNCARFDEILPDLGRPELRGTPLRESALAHADSCSRCAQLLAEVESLDRAFRALAAEESGLRAPERVEANLLQEFRREKAAVSRSGIRWQAAVGIAAAVLLAVGVSVHHWMTRPPATGPATQIPAVGSASPQAQQPAGPSAQVGAQEQPPISAAPEEAGRTVRSAPSTEQSVSEDAFTPLPYADDPTALDDGAVVRVVMPRAALASFGLPVAAMEGDGTVRADLVVSEDGTPQAIRLVSQDEASGSLR